MDDDDLEDGEDELVPIVQSYEWSNGDVVADTLVFTTNILNAVQAHVETMSIRARAHANFQDEQAAISKMTQDGVDEILRLTEPGGGSLNA